MSSLSYVLIKLTENRYGIMHQPNISVICVLCLYYLGFLITLYAIEQELISLLIIQV